MIDLSVVIPVYRSQEILRELYERLVNMLNEQGLNFEILFVEDCGGDDSWAIIEALSKGDSRVEGIQLSRNYGQHNALLCGIRAASGDVIVTMDDDLQHPPEELPKLLAKLEEGYDVVYGTPEKEPHGFFRGIASKVTKWVLQNAMGAETASKVSAFRAFRSRLCGAFAEYRSPNVNIDVMLTWATTDFCSVVVRHDPRREGKTGYTIRKLIRHAINMMTGFSTLPLQIASVTGFIFALFGFLVLAYVVGRYLFVGSVVPGFAFLASIVAIFSGAQLLALGIIGEYLARIHFRTMDRPAYLVVKRAQQGELD